MRGKCIEGAIQRRGRQRRSLPTPVTLLQAVLLRLPCTAAYTHSRYTFLLSPYFTYQPTVYHLMTTVASAQAFTLPPTVPVVHPPHLEGDPSFATEILPGPPSLQSVQQAANRKDTKKPSTFVSYLPVSDPGSTYGGLAVAGALAAPLDPDEPRRKRARTDKYVLPLVYMKTTLLTEPLSPRSPFGVFL